MTARDYFRLAVEKYNKGDVEVLLSHPLPCNGPLLACTVNGIDLVGGMREGFSKNSRYRSVNFMRDYMDIPEPAAELLYSSVRCGISHQGMPKIGLNFFQLQERPEPGKVLYRDDHSLWLNVTELARLYVDAVNLIGSSPDEHVWHVPHPNAKDAAQFADAASQIGDRIEELCRKLDDIRYDPRTMGSRSAAMPSNTLPPPLEVPAVR